MRCSALVYFYHFYLFCALRKQGNPRSDLTLFTSRNHKSVVGMFNNVPWSIKYTRQNIVNKLKTVFGEYYIYIYIYEEKWSRRIRRYIS